ncbi:MAG: two-component system sensor histidine kinase NtrB [Myxococcota bacterium]
MDDTPHPRWQWIGVALLVAAITALHYLTEPGEAASHGVFRRLYYLPIVWAAFVGGVRPGLLVAGIATAAYLPHAFFMPHHLDPAATSDKVLEIVLYFGVAGLAGVLVERERRAQRRASREALERAAAEADAQRLEGLVHLTRGLAHEIRNPLGNIQGGLEIVADAVDPDDPRRKMADIAVKETQRLDRVLTDFLSFARPRDPRMEPFEPGEVVRHVAGLMAAEADARGVTLVQRDDGAPAARGDVDQTTQVLVNLVRNAVEATPEGGRVELSASAANGNVRFEVTDTGPGIPADLEAAIYDPYVTGRAEGTGLGLSIGALLVRRQGGLLHHHAREGGGTVFGFELRSAEREESA